MQWKMLITKVDNIIMISDLSVAIFGDGMTQYTKKLYQSNCVTEIFNLIYNMVSFDQNSFVSKFYAPRSNPVLST